MALLEAPVFQTPDFGTSNNLMAHAYRQQSEGMKALADASKSLGENIQKGYDADYLSMLNRYANDPTAMAQAMSSGQINQNRVSADTLSKYREYLSSAISNAKNSFELQNAKDMLDLTDTHGNSFFQAKSKYDIGDPTGGNKILQDAIARDPRAARLFLAHILNPNYDQQKIAAQYAGIAAQRAGLGLQWQRFNDEQAKMYGRRLADIYKTNYANLGLDTENTLGILQDIAKEYKIPVEYINSAYSILGAEIPDIYNISLNTPTGLGSKSKPTLTNRPKNQGEGK